MIRLVKRLFHKCKFVEIRRSLMPTGEDRVVSQCKCGKVDVKWTNDTYRKIHSGEVTNGSGHEAKR